MAKEKRTGAGATIEVDLAKDGVLWNEVGCTTTMTPPPQQRTDIDVTCQQDTSADSEPGLEQISQMTFTEPADPIYGKTWIDDLYASGDSADWRMTFKGRNGADDLVYAFEGNVSAIVPNAAGGSDMVSRVITVTRKGDITYNPA